MTDIRQGCFRPKDGFMLEQVDNELLIYHPVDALVIYCNPTAAVVWQLCDGTRTVRDIIDLLEASYPDSQGQIGNDVQGVVEELRDRGALEATANQAPRQADC